MPRETDGRPGVRIDAETTSNPTSSERPLNPGTLQHPADGIDSICDCKKVRTRHEHGHYITYKYHRCRCPKCTEANAEYCRRSRVHRRRSHPMVDAAAARARVAELQATGLLLGDIATLCGLGSHGLDHLMYGANGREATRILVTTMNALQAISYRDVVSLEVPGRRNVDGATARLQVQALHAHGWTASVLAARIGTNKTSMSMLLSGRGIREDLRVRIDAVYRELHGTEAPAETSAERARYTIAKAKAAANGWTTDMVHDAEYANVLLAS